MKKQDKNNIKVLIFGRGQIGTMYSNFLSAKGYTCKLSNCDVTNYQHLKNEIVEFSPSVVINAAGKTNLEWCDANKLEAFNVNVLGADNIASLCEIYSIYFLHLSSGCIFESTTPDDAKSEDDQPHPAAFYSWTKVWAENLITSKKKLDYLILRPRQPVSSEVSEKNMLIKMLTFSKFVGEDGGWNSGTVLEDMMDISEKMISDRVTGIFHIANEGYTTPYDIALLLKKIINPKMSFQKISHKELDSITPVKRVATVLDISKLKSLGFKVRPYEERLEEIILKLRDNLTKDLKSKDIFEKTEITSKQRTTVSEDWKDIFKSSE